MANLVLLLKANYSLLIREPVGGPPRHIPQCCHFKITQTEVQEIGCKGKKKIPKMLLI